MSGDAPYSLRDDTNKWTNLTISIDNVNRQVELFVNGEKQNLSDVGGFNDDPDNQLQITKNSNSRLKIGGGFVGKIEKLSVTNKKSNEQSEKSRNKKLRSRQNNSLMSMKFTKLSATSKTFYDSSTYRSVGKFVNASPSSTLIKDELRESLSFTDGEYLQIENNTSLNGEKMNNVTISSWIKTPLDYNNTGYEPILSRLNVFSFGLHNGHISLFLAKDGSLVPSTNIKRESANSGGVNLASSIMNDESLLVDETFDRRTIEAPSSQLILTNSTGGVLDKKGDSDIILGSRYLILDKNDKVEINRNALIGQDLSDFTFSTWVNFTSVNDNAIIFERPDIGLKLSTNALGKLVLDYIPKV